MYHHIYDEFSIPQSEQDQVLAGKLIPRGYVNGSQMCKANDKRFGNYIHNKSAKAYCDVVSLDTGIPASSLLIEIAGTPNGDPSLQGTWVHPDIATHLAHWISPAFYLWSNRVLVKVLDPKFDANDPEFQKFRAKAQQLHTEIRMKGIVTRISLTDAIEAYKSRHPELSQNDRQWLIKNATDAMYKLVFGMNAEKLEALLGCPRHTSRDFLGSNSLRAIEFAEHLICSFINNHDLHPLSAIRQVGMLGVVKDMQPEPKFETA
ncbi:MAG: KilA-N domain-containing protein [Phormidium tanganyikae FI6-MK23]|nr:KilA-N domain-containing protein [Phormidium tanganyikae FI6-MK23]